jgi:hypothetical protein
MAYWQQYEKHFPFIIQEKGILKLLMLLANDQILIHQCISIIIIIIIIITINVEWNLGSPNPC